MSNVLRKISNCNNLTLYQFSTLIPLFTFVESVPLSHSFSTKPLRPPSSPTSLPPRSRTVSSSQSGFGSSRLLYTHWTMDRPTFHRVVPIHTLPVGRMVLPTTHPLSPLSGHQRRRYPTGVTSLHQNENNRRSCRPTPSYGVTTPSLTTNPSATRHYSRHELQPRLTTPSRTKNT